MKMFIKASLFFLYAIAYNPLCAMMKEGEISPSAQHDYELLRQGLTAGSLEFVNDLLDARSVVIDNYQIATSLFRSASSSKQNPEALLELLWQHVKKKEKVAEGEDGTRSSNIPLMERMLLLQNLYLTKNNRLLKTFASRKIEEMLRLLRGLMQNTITDEERGGEEDHKEKEMDKGAEASSSHSSSGSSSSSSTSEDYRLLQVQTQAQMSSLEEQVKAQGEQLKHQDNQLKDKDTQLKIKDDQIKERDAQLKMQEHHLYLKDKQLALQEEQLKFKEEQLRFKGEQLKLLTALTVVSQAQGQQTGDRSGTT